jgi:hypothetical protein
LRDDGVALGRGQLHERLARLFMHGRVHARQGAPVQLARRHVELVAELFD